MKTTGRTPSVLFAFTALVVLATGGCATLDPSASFEETRRLVAGRHPGEALWQRDAASRTEARLRVEELLAQPLTADAAAEVALLGHPGLQATLEELGMAQADLAQAARLANPGLSWSRLAGSGETQTTFSLTADVVDWLVQPLRRRLAAAEVERVRLEVGHALLTTTERARVALIDYQLAVALAAEAARVEEIEGAAFEYGEALFAAGNLTRLERAALEAAWAEARAERRRAEIEHSGRREELTLALGLAGDSAWRAAQGPPWPPPRATADGVDWESRAVDSRLDLAAARWAVAALERALALKRRTRLSPLGVEVGVERERESGSVTLTGPVVELRLPIFDTGAASVARLQAELAQARWQAAALEAEVRSEVRRLSEELRAGEELAALYRDTIVPLRREVVERTLAEYNQMLVGTFELLAAKQAEVEAERRAREASAGYWRAHFALDLASGGLFAGPPPAGEEPETDEATDEPHLHHQPVADGGRKEAQ